MLRALLRVRPGLVQSSEALPPEGAAYDVMKASCNARQKNRRGGPPSHSHKGKHHIKGGKQHRENPPANMGCVGRGSWVVVVVVVIVVVVTVVACSWWLVVVGWSWVVGLGRGSWDVRGSWVVVIGRRVDEAVGRGCWSSMVDETVGRRWSVIAVVGGGSWAS